MLTKRCGVAAVIAGKMLIVAGGKSREGHDRGEVLKVTKVLNTETNE